MSQPTIKTAFKLIVAVFITFGLSLALQSVLGDFNGPACPPPGCNVPAPINVGSSTAPTLQGTWDSLNVAASSTQTSYGGLAVAGILTVNTKALYTNTDQRVMIGTTNTAGPSKLTIDMGNLGGEEGLHIRRQAAAGAFSYLNITNENANTIFQVNQSGNVGVGTANPGAILHSYANVSGPGSIAGRFENVNQGGRAQFILTSGAYPENFFALMTHGTSAGNTYYASTLSPNSDSGKAILLGQGTSMSEFVIGTYNAKNLGLFTNNAMRMTILSTGNVGIGNSNPLAKLDVSGTLKISGGNPGQGKVLMSDATGLASWVATSTLGLGGGSGQWTTTGSNIYSSNTGNVGVGMDPGATGKFVVLNNDPAGPTYGVYAFSSMTRPSVGVFGSGLTWAGYFVGNGFFSGNVGIGITNPGAKLEVSGGNFKITNGFMAYVKEGIGCPPGDTVVAYRTSPKFCDAGGGCPDCTTTSHDWSTTNSSVETCIYRSETAPDDCIYGSDLTCYATSYTLCNP